MPSIEDLFKRPAKTAEGLPLLTEKTRLAFIRELEREAELKGSSSAISSQWTTETWKENPELMLFLRDLIREYPEEMYGQILGGFLCVYRILKSQANNDRVQEQFSKPANEPQSIKFIKLYYS